MEESRTIEEIIDYIIQNRVSSYYELKAYAEKNRPEWFPFSKNVIAGL